MADDQNDLIPARAVAVLIGGPSAVSEWERLGLLPRAGERDGLPLYRAADVRRVMIAQVSRSPSGDSPNGIGSGRSTDQTSVHRHIASKTYEDLERLKQGLVKLYGPLGAPAGDLAFFVADYFVNRITPSSGAAKYGKEPVTVQSARPLNEQDAARGVKQLRPREESNPAPIAGRRRRADQHRA